MKAVKQGSIITGPNWPEPVVVKLIEEIGDFIHIVGATKSSGEHIDQLIPKEEFQKIIVDDKKISFSEEAWKVFLALETVRYRFASMYDPLLAMHTSKVDPLPHQIEAVYGYVLKLPRIRFLIADDQGNVLYRWDFGEAKVLFDEARKLATSCGIDRASEWNKNGFIKKEKEFIKVLGPQERKAEDLNGSSELIDVLHNVLLLREKSKRDDMIKLLNETGYGESEAFYRVAQAISETLPKESKEKTSLTASLQEGKG